jgi:hypothetical protein
MYTDIQDYTTALALHAEAVSLGLANVSLTSSIIQRCCEVTMRTVTVYEMVCV